MEAASYLEEEEDPLSCQAASFPWEEAVPSYQVEVVVLPFQEVEAHASQGAAFHEVAPLALVALSFLQAVEVHASEDKPLEVERFLCLAVAWRSNQDLQLLERDQPIPLERPSLLERRFLFHLGFLYLGLQELKLLHRLASSCPQLVEVPRLIKKPHTLL